MFILIACYQKIAFAQTTETLIANIKIKYGDTQKHISSYDTTIIEIWDESTDGGQATGYFDKEDLKLIIVWWLGETGRRKMEMYYDDGELFFALNSNYEYNRPYYYDDKMAKENNDTEIFDPNKTIIREDRYYFHQGKLIRMLDNDKKMIDPSSSDFLKAKNEILEKADRFKNKFRK